MALGKLLRGFKYQQRRKTEKCTMVCRAYVDIVVFFCDLCPFLMCVADFAWLCLSLHRPRLRPSTVSLSSLRQYKCSTTPHTRYKFSFDPLASFSPFSPLRLHSTTLALQKRPSKRRRYGCLFLIKFHCALMRNPISFKLLHTKRKETRDLYILSFSVSCFLSFSLFSSLSFYLSSLVLSLSVLISLSMCPSLPFYVSLFGFHQSAAPHVDHLCGTFPRIIKSETMCDKMYFCTNMSDNVQIAPECTFVRTRTTMYK